MTPVQSSSPSSPSSPSAPSPLSPAQERLARKRVNAKMGWYTHALVYVLVNAALALMAGLKQQSWAIYPAFGWGLGLLIHGLAVFLGGTGLRQHLLARERARMATHPDAG